MAKDSRPVKKILWFASALRQSGGGERLLLEGVEHFQRMGIETSLVTFKFYEDALFNHRYNLQHVIELLKDRGRFATYTGFRALTYLGRAVVVLRKAIADLDPDAIVVQSEDNAILMWLATLGMRYHYVLLMFGQMFQFPEDLTKYALVFRKHLAEIRNSMVGYEQTIPPAAPPMSLPKRLMVELWACARYLAVRKAIRIFPLSRQVKWEVSKLYGRDSQAFKGAFPASIFEYHPSPEVRQELGLPEGKLVLSVSRLARKKNIALCIRAFKEVADNLPDVTFIVGGIGPEEANLKELAQQLGLASRVIFVGFIQEQRLWDYYSVCDVFFEMDTADFNLVLYEVLAFGKKVVLSTDQELDDSLVESRFIFTARPQVQPVARALDSALVSESRDMTSDEKAMLMQYTWDNYFSNILREIEIID